MHRRRSPCSMLVRSHERSAVCDLRWFMRRWCLSRGAGRGWGAEEMHRAATEAVAASSDAPRARNGLAASSGSSGGSSAAAAAPAPAAAAAAAPAVREATSAAVQSSFQVPVPPV